MFVLLRLTYFTQHNTLQFHPRWSKWWVFVISNSWVIFHCIHKPHLLFILELCKLQNSWVLGHIFPVSRCKKTPYKNVHRELLHMCKDFPHDVSLEDYTLKQWGSTRLPSVWLKFNTTSTSDGAQDVGQQELSFTAGGNAKCPSCLRT